MKDIDNASKDFLNRLFTENNKLHNEFTFVTLFCWNDFAKYKYFMSQANVIIYTEKNDYLYMPIGKEISPEDLVKISKQFNGNGKSGNFLLVDTAFADKHREYLSHYYNITIDRANYDYVYEASALANLSGRNYDKKRNLIHQFEKNHPNWECRPMTNRDGELCIKLAYEWCKIRNCEDENLRNEHQAIIKAIANYDFLELSGTLLFTEPNVLVGFALYSKKHDQMYVTHFEKSCPNVKGASQVLNRGTAKHIIEKGGSLINREQDMGIDGLRQAKLSYFPKFFVETCKLEFLNPLK